ncbi:OLC1v1011030C1 [Oldenlandia corymbosa var. corymbosa]|uniref:OLC1v1011030C1 n=1 Tax=Oldenlandia corymbosa var. corymbosa TaxID=529605 RepID=A0AAV1DSS6_OLDCO|nr:OLC1v1011030C1 [Oldenlandia corymbosa var. corymbosa]
MGRLKARMCFTGFRIIRLVKGRRKGLLLLIMLLPNHLLLPCKDLVFGGLMINLSTQLLHHPSAIPSSSGCASGLAAAYNNLVGNNVYGSLAMEKSFRDCSLANGFCGDNNKPMMTNSFSWAASGPLVDPMYNPSPYPIYVKKDSSFGEEEEEEEEVPEIETLPLFPLHGEDSGFNKQQPNGNAYYSSWYPQYSNGGVNMACSRASLELTLNSYGVGWSSNN